MRKEVGKLVFELGHFKWALLLCVTGLNPTLLFMRLVYGSWQRSDVGYTTEVRAFIPVSPSGELATRSVDNSLKLKNINLIKEVYYYKIDVSLSYQFNGDVVCDNSSVKCGSKWFKSTPLPETFVIVKDGKKKTMCHLNLGNLMDFQERHITNYEVRGSGVQGQFNRASFPKYQRFLLASTRVCHPLDCFDWSGWFRVGLPFFQGT
ncbi:hypothetical protein J6590_054238 [Homalodisca vitripennis]|nr:hypothetical protein J6590_054238 [Homalodisca vitripennis]